MPRSGEVHATTRRPDTPRDADFALRIDFKRGEPNPHRIFQAADLMIRALQGLDATLVGAIDTKIEPIMVLEEIESGSLFIWLRNILTATDDEALKKLDLETCGRQILGSRKARLYTMGKQRGTRPHTFGSWSGNS